MSSPLAKHIKPKDYLASERESTDRHEYYLGEVFAMSGASFEHNVIEDNLRVALGIHLRDQNCRSFGGNLRIHIPANTLYTYPDIVVLCDEPQFVDEQFDTLINPAMLIEILSPSTANYDRGAKWDLYREIASLKEYVLIDSTAIHLVHFTKNTDGSWLLTETKSRDDVVQSALLDFTFSLKEIYRNTKHLES